MFCGKHKKNTRWSSRQLDTRYETVKEILSHHVFTCKMDYLKLRLDDNRLPFDPKATFKSNFKGWVDYLNIKGNFYNFETCKSKVHDLVMANPSFKWTSGWNFDDLSQTICSMDSRFPPADL